LRSRIAISDDEAQVNENTEFRKTQLLSKQVERYTLVAWPPINANLAFGQRMQEARPSNGFGQIWFKLIAAVNQPVPYRSAGAILSG